MLVRTLFLSLAFTVPSCLAQNSIITNNIPWLDTAGNTIKANRKPNISKRIGDYWYLVGSESSPPDDLGSLVDPDSQSDQKAGGSIFIYRSETLGSNSWELVKNIVQKNSTEKLNVYSCQMNKYDDDTVSIEESTVYLHCRTTVCVSTNGPEGDYDCDNKLNMPNYKPKNPPNTRKVGGSSTFRDDDGLLYFVTSRKLHDMEDSDRKAFIYKFNKDDWTEIVEAPVASWPYPNRESPYIVKNNGTYYVFTSKTAGWGDSKTYYLKRDNLTGFDADEEPKDEREVAMHPSNTGGIKSMGTQFGFIQKFDDDKWFFGGRRHPVEDPCNFRPKYGKLVMTPFQFDDDGVPHVYWKESFDWKSTDYDATDFEEHNVESYRRTDNPDTTDKFLIPTGEMKKCKYIARENTKWRCKLEGVADKCKNTCCCERFDNCLAN